MQIRTILLGLMICRVVSLGAAEPAAAPSPPPAPPPIKAGDKVVVLQDNTPVMWESKALLTVAKGAEFTASAVQKNWVRVSGKKDGRDFTGWIALKNVRRAGVKQPSEEAVTLFRRGTVLLKGGSLDNALAELDKCIQIDPEFALAYGTRGSVWVKKGNADKALADYSESIRLDP